LPESIEMKDIEIRLTSDGSKTLYLPSLDETYHSNHGAIQEAKHVFIEHGLKHVHEFGMEKIRIFEMGFGTGLNALLTAQWAMENQQHMEYIGIELHPVDKEIWQQMDYVQSSEDVALYERIMSCEWESTQEINAFFKLKKIAQDVTQVALSDRVDLIYFDAFGPRAQIEMWDLPVLQKMHELLNDGGIFVTYCAQGQMKRHLKSLGFEITSLPGPPGKREMTRAKKLM
jgi:tRNA U34 5-methylaminomethyl-2-thiouridine-forming methyltransferase MnmC